MPAWALQPRSSAEQRGFAIVTLEHTGRWGVLRRFTVSAPVATEDKTVAMDGARDVHLLAAPAATMSGARSPLTCDRLSSNVRPAVSTPCAVVHGS